MLHYFNLPGYGGSGPKHWQTLWEKMDPTFERVEQQNWKHPVCSEWVATLDAKVTASAGPIILVAHSLACLLVAHWAVVASPGNVAKVTGAFLVGFPDTGSSVFPEAALDFAPLPLNPLPFPSLIVASTDDPYGTPEFARQCARAFGGGIVILGARGHINGDSGLGTWEEGRKLLDAFTLF